MYISSHEMLLTCVDKISKSLLWMYISSHEMLLTCVNKISKSLLGMYISSHEMLLTCVDKISKSLLGMYISSHEMLLDCISHELLPVQNFRRIGLLLRSSNRADSLGALYILVSNAFRWAVVLLPRTPTPKQDL